MKNLTRAMEAFAVSSRIDINYKESFATRDESLASYIMLLDVINHLSTKFFVYIIDEPWVQESYWGNGPDKQMLYTVKAKFSINGEPNKPGVFYGKDLAV